MSIRKGNTILAGNVEAVYDTDDITINSNAQHKFQVIGTLNKKDANPIYDWVGTKAEYAALTEYNDDWIYYITDDLKETVAINNTIGQIIATLCNANYIPDGCIPCDGKEYNAVDFSDFWNKYLATLPSKLLTCSYNEYNTSITTYGQCAKFAIDLDNNKFKAPTIKDGSFLQQAQSDSELGKAYNAGLPNIIGDVRIGRDNTHCWQVKDASGVFYNTGSFNGITETGSSTSTASGLGFNASRSNSIYGNSDTVQPEAVAVRYFVVIVNNYVNTSDFNWTEYKTNLDGKADKDLNNTGHLTNCVTNIQQDIKVELVNNILTLKAGSKLYIPNGFETDGITPHFDIMILESDVFLSTGGASGSKFLLYHYRDGSPALSGIKTENTWSGTVGPSETGIYQTFYSITDNKIYTDIDKTNNWNWLETALPLGLITSDGTNIVSLNQVFNGFGFISRVTFSLPGVKCLFADGLNADGTVKNKEVIFDKVTLRSFGMDEYSYQGSLMEDGRLVSWGNNNVYIQDSTPKSSDQWILWYDTRRNIVVYTDDYQATWYKTYRIIGWPLVKAATNNITECKPPKVMRIQTNDNISVIETYHNGVYWYRIWSDGWCEQGGQTTVSANHADIVFLKPYKDTNYSINVTTANTASNTSGVSVVHIASAVTATGFTLSQTNTSQRYSFWSTAGYMA